MFAVWKNIAGYDALAVCLGKLNQWHWTRRLFVEDRAQLGFRNDLFKHGELGAVEMIFLLLVVEMPQIQRPDTNLRDFKWMPPLWHNLSAYDTNLAFGLAARLCCPAL